MIKTRLYRWACLALGTAVTVFAFEGCVVKDLLDSILGGQTGA